MSDETMKEIMDRIRQRRLDLQYSFQDLADLTGMSKSTLQRYETGGIKNIPLDKLKIFAKALGVTPEWILGMDSPGDDLSEYLDQLRTRPELRTLFSVSKNATKEDVEKAIKIIEMFKEESR